MLSKTRFQYAMICRKRAWLDAHRRELGRPPDRALRLRLADGHRIGRIARELWPGGVLVTEPSARHARAAARTSLLIEDPSVSAIFEGAFAHDGLRIRADVLARHESSFELIEVKSSARPRDEHILDLAIQAHVIDASGLELASASLLHVNPEYVWQGGALDPSDLFVRVDLTEDVFRRLPEVRERERDFRAVLSAPEPPAIAMGPQCHKHDACPFLDVCRREAGVPASSSPDGSVRSAAILVPPLTTGTPISLLDVEAFSTALPRIPGSSPHERVPFLWSLRIVRPDGSIEDRQGLPPFDRDPRPAFAASLAADLPTEGPVVYASEAVPRAIEALAARDLAGARVCAERLTTDGADMLSRFAAALGPMADPADRIWEELMAATIAADSSTVFTSRGEAAAAYVDAIDRAAPRSRREMLAGALARHGRCRVAALAVLAGVARVGPRV